MGFPTCVGRSEPGETLATKAAGTLKRIKGSEAWQMDALLQAVPDRLSQAPRPCVRRRPHLLTPACLCSLHSRVTGPIHPVWCHPVPSSTASSTWAGPSLVPGVAGGTERMTLCRMAWAHPRPQAKRPCNGRLGTRAQESTAAPLPLGHMATKLDGENHELNCFRNSCLDLDKERLPSGLAHAACGRSREGDKTRAEDPHGYASPTM